MYASLAQNYVFVYKIYTKLKIIPILHTTKNFLHLNIIKNYFCKKDQKKNFFLIRMHPTFDSSFQM